MEKINLTKMTVLVPRGRYRYMAMKEGEIIADRYSDREYVAALVMRNSINNEYYIYHCYGRIDLLPKKYPNADCYLAILEEFKDKILI